VRLITWDVDEPIDAALLRRRLQRALQARQLLPGPQPAAQRLVFSEADGLPGLVVDRYAGYLVVQILNYDRILARHVVELPTLVSEDPPLRFVRRYDYSAGDRVVQFRTELTVREAGGERTVSNTVPLCILSKEALERLAREAGFRHLEVFGGFGGEPLGPDSLPLILCARPER
jgi:hypothetical protein